jgi:hypothetical protein
MDEGLPDKGLWSLTGSRNMYRKKAYFSSLLKIRITEDRVRASQIQWDIIKSRPYIA